MHKKLKLKKGTDNDDQIMASAVFAAMLPQKTPGTSDLILHKLTFNG